MILVLLAFQAATALPDVDLRARVQARRVEIENSGNALLTVRASPDAGSSVEVRAPRANGRKTLGNVDVNIHAQAQISDPAAPAIDVLTTKGLPHALNDTDFPLSNSGVDRPRAIQLIKGNDAERR